ncbi:DUF1918 domain-containing protein [Streptomyces sp. NPDC059819]|uniref:DUF1918 domain-containing protein n=1 Tax=Streptomyces sp. NPDC059819 TaxID=3346963 RepID=UPI0036521EB6
MRASVGDKVVNVKDNTVVGEIIEVRGEAGEPPYLVRAEDGHVALVASGRDIQVRRAEAR